MVFAKQASDANADLEHVTHHASDIHSVIAITDANGIITYVNRNFLRLSGYNWDELVGKTHSVVNSGMHPPEFFDKMWQRIATGKAWRGNVQNRTKNGDLYWVDTTICPMFDDDARICGYTSVRTDVTALVKGKERRKQEAESATCLKALHEIDCGEISVAGVLDNALDILLSVSWLNLSGSGGVYLNDFFTNELRLVASKNMDELETECSKISYGHCLCGSAPQTEELQYTNDDDELSVKTSESKRPYGHYNVLLKHENDMLGVLVIYLGQREKLNQRQETFLKTFCTTLALIISLKQEQQRLKTEVQRSKDLARQAQKASEQAMQAAEAKANFLATMSHEIRTPMNSVLGMLYLMEESDLSEEQREFAAIGRSSADSLMRIIDDILDFSKYEQGSFTLEEVEFDFSEFIKECLEPFKAPAQSKGVELSLQINENLPSEIIGDPARYRQLITNLISNALKFTSEGRILVKVDLVKENDKQQLLIVVADSGTGIEPKALEHIFERFSQADTSITRKYGGTGLGLAICKTLVEAMDGEIGVDTIMGEGSSFWMKLPFIAAENEQGKSPVNKASPDEKVFIMPLNILVAEDNMNNQFLIRKMLEANSHHVTCVDDGLQAVELAATMEFDVILMDLQMPVLDGLGAAQEIRKLHQPYGSIPIYAVSANALGKHHAQSKAAGMDGHINKPIHPAELFKVLEKISLDKDADAALPMAKAG